MNKIIIIATIVVIAITIYVLTHPNAEKPIIKMPELTEKQPTQPPAAPTPDASKIQTEDIKLGTGDEAVPGKKVSVQYKGTLTDGTEFDSSYSRNNEPLTFTVAAGQMIPGFDYGVRGMKVGGTRKITIPPELGYGNQAMGDKIPANSTLIFEVVLEKVE
jgi:FKBP-type peptidyl-prolyl cis-trans isomerase